MKFCAKNAWLPSTARSRIVLPKGPVSVLPPGVLGRKVRVPGCGPGVVLGAVSDGSLIVIDAEPCEQGDVY